MNFLYSSFLFVSLMLLGACVSAQQKNTIYPGEIWTDDNGKHIQAHGGGIIRLIKSGKWKYVKTDSTKNRFN